MPLLNYLRILRYPQCRSLPRYAPAAASVSTGFRLFKDEVVGSDEPVAEQKVSSSGPRIKKHAASDRDFKKFELAKLALQSNKKKGSVGKLRKRVKVCYTKRRLVRVLRELGLTLGRRVGLVPTMGALHDGHIELIRQAWSENPLVVVSIYVNPTQFGVNEDLSAYPRTLPQDLAKLKELEVILREEKEGRLIVFAPTTEIMYPNVPPSSELDGQGSFVTITPMGSLLEGASRPVFFRGVATVCMKLFNIVRPAAVYFGRKDVQQSSLIRRLIEDFHMIPRLRVVDTVREPDGLAQSSRNVFLGTRRRIAALALSEGLQIANDTLVNQGKRQREEILGPARDYINEKAAIQAALLPSQRARFSLDYISLADYLSMEEIEFVKEGQVVVVSAAMKMEPVEEPSEGEHTGEGDGGSRTIRLIDNIVFPPGTSLDAESGRLPRSEDDVVLEESEEAVANTRDIGNGNYQLVG